MRGSGSTEARCARSSPILPTRRSARSAASWCSSRRNEPAAAGRGAAFYWRYEKFIRSTEARADSTIGATGAIYAIRRALFEADSGRHDPRRRAHPAANRAARLPGAVRAGGARVRPGVADRAAGVRAQGAHDCRHVPAVRARAVAAQPAAQPPLVRNDVAQGAASGACRSFTCCCSSVHACWRRSGRTGGRLSARWRSTWPRGPAIPSGSGGRSSSPFPARCACSSGRRWLASCDSRRGGSR